MHDATGSGRTPRAAIGQLLSTCRLAMPDLRSTCRFLDAACRSTHVDDADRARCTPVAGRVPGRCCAGVCGL